jgi:cytoskeletal protein RodZ
MKKTILIIIIGVVISIGGGFWVGRQVAGSSPSPGSVFDPLVTQGYAQQSVDDRVKVLESRLEELEMRTQVLENELQALQSKAGLPVTTIKPVVPTTPASPATSANPTTTAPATSQAVPVDVIGKTAGISSGNSAVNLRQGPNTSSAVIKTLGPSDTFTIVKVDKDWYQVQLSDGSTGWIAGWLVAVGG